MIARAEENIAYHALTAKVKEELSDHYCIIWRYYYSAEESFVALKCQQRLQNVWQKERKKKKKKSV